jgi:hypothetical protein
MPLKIYGIHSGKLPSCFACFKYSLKLIDATESEALNPLPNIPGPKKINIKTNKINIA